MAAKIIRLPNAFSRLETDDADAVEPPVMIELRRARIRIAQLEASLTEAMRDNLANFNRARAAERRLEEIEN